MEASASLKQTITHLFDAVRFADHANELEESARNLEGDLEASLNKLEAQTEELTNALAGMKAQRETVLKELSQQVDGFLATAKEQAKSKLQKAAKQQLEDFRRAISSEKDKAQKSLEAYFAADPLPIIDSAVQVRLTEGVYEARSRYECEGGIKYDFRLASQNSKLFHQTFTFSQLGHELRVPVRFSRALLSKTRTPGFERLDQYELSDAETSGGKLRANFQKSGNGAKIKVVTSGDQDDDFVSLEYSDSVQAVNVMNDPSLLALVNIDAIRKAASELITELNDLSRKKVALLRLAVNGAESLDGGSSGEILTKVMKVMGTKYRASIKQLAAGIPLDGAEDLDAEFLSSRLKLLGSEMSKNVSQALGLAIPQ